MATVFKFGVIFCLFAVAFSKKLHVKEDLETKDIETRSFINFFSNEEMPATKERFVRHNIIQQAVTESVLEHLISELKQQYFSENYNANSPIRRLIRNLSKEMKRNEHNKMIKERKKKRLANKAKNLAKNKAKANKKNKKANMKSASTMKMSPKIPVTPHSDLIDLY